MLVLTPKGPLLGTGREGAGRAGNDWVPGLLLPQWHFPASLSPAGNCGPLILLPQLVST